MIYCKYYNSEAEADNIAEDLASFEQTDAFIKSLCEII